MKTNSDTTPHEQSNLNTTNTAGNPGLSFKLGLDVDLRTIVVAMQCGNGTIGSAQKLTRGRLLEWVKEKIAAGHAVHTVYECCGFGYTLHEQLTQAGAQIRQCKQHQDRLTQQLEALVAGEKIPHGLGALTVSLLEGEVCSWHRFSHRKAVGSYTGCCPSEHSSGGQQRFGAIDRHGNKTVRVLLVEAVWRLLKWQPQWHARQKFLPKLKHGQSLKKK